MSIVETGKVVGAGIVAILIIALVASSVFGVAHDTTVSDVQTASTAVTAGSATLPLPNGASVNSHQSSVTSLGSQIQLSGGDTSEVSLKSDADLSGDWAVCTYAAATDTAVNADAKRSVIGYEYASIWYDGANDTYHGYYYDEASRSATDVTVAAPNAKNSSLLCLQQEGSTLTIYRNTTAGTQASIGSGGPAPPAANWNGTIEETRIYNTSLNASQRSEWVGEPVLAVQGEAPAIRLTYDVRNRGATSVRAYFDGGTAKLSGASFVNGFAGPDIAAGVDYQWSGANNAQFKILSGSVLETEGEVIYHSYSIAQFGGLINTIGDLGMAALSLLVIGLLIKAAFAVQEAFGGTM